MADFRMVDCKVGGGVEGMAAGLTSALPARARILLFLSQQLPWEPLQRAASDYELQRLLRSWKVVGSVWVGRQAGGGGSLGLQCLWHFSLQ